ncbi:hypothetical protein AOR_1_1362144 [Paecilomyces variotii No. 5]|uniref:STE24 endopeptidase n=1 Tax=Byssochlamys spectabilis (strain No. 5 / NBRC 109023) TaxID=1356009 RepID=V5G6G0_BYSSN|nr:hypothetical protein AOR_1_1362144 [Paecilomyces variotii No. 5]
MPTPLDRALHSKNLFIGFAGLVTAVAAWGIWGGDIFPAEPDPTGNPDEWTTEDMKRWLRRRGLMPSDHASREELLERIKANMRPGRS